MEELNRPATPKAPAYGFEQSENGQLYLCRYRSPRWRLRLDDPELPKEKLAASLRKAAEWLVKRADRT